MWKRSAEKAGSGDFAEAGAAALTWKVEAEKASRGLPPNPPQPHPHSPLLPRTSNPSSRPKPLPTQTLPRYHPTPAPTCPHAPNH